MQKVNLEKPLDRVEVNKSVVAPNLNAMTEAHVRTSSMSKHSNTKGSKPSIIQNSNFQTKEYLKTSKDSSNLFLPVLKSKQSI